MADAMGKVFIKTMKGSESFFFKTTSHPKDREMNSGEIRIFSLAGEVSSVYQLPEQVVTEKIGEKFRSITVINQLIHSITTVVDVKIYVV